MSFSKYGDNACLYRVLEVRSDLRLVKKKERLFVYKWEGVFKLINPSILFAFAVVVVVCVVEIDSDSVTKTSRSLYGLFFAMCNTLHLSSLNAKSHCLDQTDKLFKSSWINCFSYNYTFQNLKSLIIIIKIMIILINLLRNVEASKFYEDKKEIVHIGIIYRVIKSKMALISWK